MVQEVILLLYYSSVITILYFSSCDKRDVSKLVELEDDGGNKDVDDANEQ